MNISSNLLGVALPGGGGAKCSPICLCLSRPSITLKITPSPHGNKKKISSRRAAKHFRPLMRQPPSPSKKCSEWQQMRANLHMIGQIRTKPLILNLTPGMHDNNNGSGKSGTCADLKRAVCDVVDVHGEDVVFAAHVHPVLVLVHMQDPVVHGLVWYGVVFEGLGRLQVWDTHTHTIRVGKKKREGWGETYK